MVERVVGVEKEDRQDTARDIRDNSKAKKHGAKASFVRRDQWSRCFICKTRIRPRAGRYEATQAAEMEDGVYLVVVCKECWDLDPEPYDD